MSEVKKRKIRKTDWDAIETYLEDELDRRQSDQFRKDHERVWKEVDRQKNLQPMDIVPKGEKREEYAWRNVIELGEIAKAAEVITADVMRICFPQDRRWFDAHCEIPPQMTPDGPKVDPHAQMECDRVVRSLMLQQHSDFGFMDRVKLSVNEAMYHGSFVAETLWQTEMMVQGGESVVTIGAPVWQPLSMWNCYPDPSPSILSTGMFYPGSMMIESYMPRHKLKEMTGSGWMRGRFRDITDDEHDVEGRKTKDYKLVTYYGDLAMDRDDGDIFLPNCKAITANGTLVFYQPNELPYPSVIYGGYERQDVRDPYYTSPIIKYSPIQKMSSKLASRFLDAIDLRIEPPLVYDANDPQFAIDGGPVIAPGMKTGSKGGAEVKPIEVGDPSVALKGLELMLKVQQEGQGVSSVRAGAVASDRATAYEVSKVAQGGEVRTVEFIRGLTANLRSFLYMQHALNKQQLTSYSFYNDEMDTPDFLRLSKDQLPDNAHFDVTGAKGLLGEENRINRTTAVTAFAAGNPLFAPRLEVDELLLDMYRDAGQKNPERFLNKNPQVPPEVQAQMQQAQEQMQKMDEIIQKLTADLAKEKMHTEAKMAELEMKREEKGAGLQMERQQMIAEHQLKVAELVKNYELEMAKFRADVTLEHQKLSADNALQQHKQSADIELKMRDIEHKAGGQKEQKAKQTPKEIVVSTGNKTITLKRDKAGVLTGAEVETEGAGKTSIKLNHNKDGAITSADVR